MRRSSAPLLALAVVFHTGAALASASADPAFASWGRVANGARHVLQAEPEPVPGGDYPLPWWYKPMRQGYQGEPPSWHNASKTVIWVPSIVLAAMIVVLTLLLYVVKHVLPKWSDKLRLRQEREAAVEVTKPGEGRLRRASMEFVQTGIYKLTDLHTGEKSAVAQALQGKQADHLGNEITVDEVSLTIYDEQDQFWPLMKIFLPAILTILFCPVMMSLISDLEEAFWPGGLPFQSYKSSFGEINAPIEAFLNPAGLLYALIFGFSYEAALNKQTGVQKLMYEEINYLHEMVNILSKTETTRDKKVIMEKHRCITVVRAQAIYMAESLRNEAHVASRTHHFVINIWEMIEHLKVISGDGVGDSVDEVLVERTMDLMQKFTTASAHRHALLARRMSTPQWLFMELLSYTNFSAILMIRAGSYDFELAFSFITAVSMAVLTWIIADMDEPFHGFFKISIQEPVSTIMRKADGLMREIWSEVEHVDTMTQLGEDGYGEFLAHQPDSLPGMSKAERMRVEAFGDDWREKLMAIEAKKQLLSTGMGGGARKKNKNQAMVMAMLEHGSRDHSREGSIAGSMSRTSSKASLSDLLGPQPVTEAREAAPTAAPRSSVGAWMASFLPGSPAP